MNRSADHARAVTGGVLRDDPRAGRPADPVYVERGEALMAQWAAEDGNPELRVVVAEGSGDAA